MSNVEKAMRIFVPVDSVPINERGTSDTAWLVPYRCGLPFALDIDAGARRDEADQRLMVISSPGDRPIARDCPALSSST